MNDAKFRVGLIQMACSPDPDENLAKAGGAFAKRPDAGRRLSVCRNCSARSTSAAKRTPTCSIWPSPSPGPRRESLAKLAKRAERGDRRLAFRTARAGRVSQHRGDASTPTARCSGIYRKMHIPDDPLYFEKYLLHARAIWASATSTRSTARIGDAGLLGPVVSRSARAWRRSAARRFCSIPTAIGWHPSEKAEYGAAQHDAWRTIQRAHAIANGVYVAAVNRVGFEGPPDHGLEFWGGSFVADPFGQVIAEASHDQEEILVVECDPRAIEEVRRNWPFLRDRRIDAYGPILNRVID